MKRFLSKLPPFTLLLIVLSIINGVFFLLRVKKIYCGGNIYQEAMIGFCFLSYIISLSDKNNRRKDGGLLSVFFKWDRGNDLKKVCSLTALMIHMILIFFSVITYLFNLVVFVWFYIFASLPLILLIFLYFLLIRGNLKPYVEPMLKFILALVLAMFTFIAKMFSTQMVNEVADISTDKLTYFSWLVFGMMFVLFCALLFYSFLFLIFIVMDKSAKNKYNLNQLAINKLLILALTYYVTLIFIVIFSSKVIINYLLALTYPFDTTSSFKCDEHYHVVPGLGPEARYIATGENEYRAFYLKKGDVYVLGIQCKKEEKAPETKVVYRYLPAPAPTRHASAAKPANRKKTATSVTPKKKEPVLPYQCYDIKRAKDLLAEDTDSKRQEAEKKVKALCTPAAPVKK